MTLSDFCAMMEQVAPCELAMDFDNVGLLVSPDQDEIRRVLVALDCSVAVANEAASGGYDLVLTHHPLFFHPVKRMLHSDPATAAACALLRHGVGLFAAHTNLDAAEGGVNDTLCAILGIGGTSPIDEGVARIGTLEHEEPLGSFLKRVEQTLQTTAFLTGDAQARVKRVAVIGGSGASALLCAAEAGADVLLTGEMQHAAALDALALGLPVVCAGHYETERVVLDALIGRLQALSNDVQYNLSRADGSPFRRL